MQQWQLQVAKAKFSEVVKQAMTHGPQAVTLRNEPAVIIISKKDFDLLIKPKKSFVEFLRDSPLVGATLKLERDKSLARDVKL